MKNSSGKICKNCKATHDKKSCPCCGSGNGYLEKTPKVQKDVYVTKPFLSIQKTNI